MKKIILTLFAIALATCGMAKKQPKPVLSFDTTKGEVETITTPHGRVISYTAYTHLYYVTNIEDSTYQYLNIFVPEGATQSTPIFMPNYVGGYMASAPRYPDANDASGRALAEGYVVVIPGARGRNSVVTGKKGKKVYTGRAPKTILDLKAAVRYLRKFDAEIPGDAEKIITDGTSAGGAMSALLGATANDSIYEPYLQAMGAADTKDNIFAAVCFCPIIDLDHADMAYEWLYGQTNADTRLNTTDLQRVSEELKQQYPEYIRSLNLKKEDGTPLTADNYLEYIKKFIIRSAQDAKDAGATIPDSIGFVFSGTAGFSAPVNGGKKKDAPFNDGKMGKPFDDGKMGKPFDDGKMGKPFDDGKMGKPFDDGKMGKPEQGNGLPPDIPADVRKMMMGRGKSQGDCIVDLDMPTYLSYVASTIALKPCPSFDNKGVAGNSGTGENDEFGDDTGSSINYTDYALQQATGNHDAEIDAVTREHVRMLNPMPFIVEGNDNVAPHWYIRHGARDRDTSFPIPINLATKLQNCGKDVDFKLPWNRPHSGDYALNELFRWIKDITK